MARGGRPSRLAHGVAQAIVDGQKNQPFYTAARQEERGEVQRIQGTQRLARGHVPGQLADRGCELPQLAPRPQLLQLALDVGDAGFRYPAELAHPKERPRGFHEREARREQGLRRLETGLDLACRAGLERRPQQRRSVHIQSGQAHPSERSPRTSSRIRWALPAGSPSPRTFQVHLPLGKLARVSSPASASVSSTSSSVSAGADRRLTGRNSATTSSRSVTRTVSPAFTCRMYSERRAFSSLMPTDFMASW